jgi:hypothetical protein
MNGTHIRCLSILNGRMIEEERYPYPLPLHFKWEAAFFSVFGRHPGTRGGGMMLLHVAWLQRACN